MAYKLIWVPEVLRDAGLTVVEIDGWETRGHGDMSEVKGLLLHHTAEKIDDDKKPVLKVLTDGRPAGPGVKALLGPLANLGLGQNGVFYMIAAGLAWHAGPGIWRGVSTGNSSFIGVEAENNGIGEPWPSIQLNALARGSAAIARFAKFGVEMVAGHKEYALPPGRKIDPNFDMNAFRKQIEPFMIAPQSTSIIAGEKIIRPVFNIALLRSTAKMLLDAANEIERLRG